MDNPAASGQREGQTGLGTLVGSCQGRSAEDLGRHRALYVKRSALGVGLLGDPNHRPGPASTLGDGRIADDRKRGLQAEILPAARGQLQNQHITGGRQVGPGFYRGTGHKRLGSDLGVLQVLGDGIVRWQIGLLGFRRSLDCQPG